MSITTKIIAPIWILGLCLAGLAVFIESATLVPRFDEQAMQRARTISRAIGYAATNNPHPGSVDRIVTALSSEGDIEMIVVVRGQPERIVASTRPHDKGLPPSTLPPALQAQLRTTLTTGVPAKWTEGSSDTFGMIEPMRFSADTPEAGPGAVAVLLDHRPLTNAVTELIWVGVRRKLMLILMVTLVALVTMRLFIFRPLDALRSVAERLRAGDLQSRVPVTTRDELGELGHIINEAMDARAVSEHKLTQALERLELAARGGNAGLWDWHVGSSQAYYSPHFKALLGEDDTSMPDTVEALRSRVHPEDQTLRDTALQAHIEGHGAFDVTIRVRHCDGGLRWFRERGEIVRDGHGGPLRIAGSFADVTARMHLEADLRSAKDAAERAMQVKSAFLATMSHEIRTPMNGVLGMAELLLASNLSQEQRECADTIRRSGDALLRIIDDVLDVSKIEAGKLTLESAPFDLDAAVDDVVELLAEKARGRNVRAVPVLDADVPQWVTGDVTRVRQILVNLVGNAVKFTENGDIVIRVRLVERDARALVLRFEITDTGIGVAADMMPLLFEPFVQADSSTTRRFGGTGLGLTISKRLTEQMGGAIGVESVPGQGSTFWFTVRLAASAVQTESAPLAGRRTLVMADHAPTREALSARLRRLGASVESVTGAAPVPIDRREFDVVIVEDGTAAASTVSAMYADGSRPTAILLRQTASLQDASSAVDLRDSLGSAIEVLNGIRASQIARAVAPALTLMPEPAADSTHGPATHAPSRSTPRILVVEDNRTNQKVAQKMLEGLGYAADIVANGQLGLDAHATEPYDLILMDCQMPVMDGYEASRAIRKLGPDARSVPIVALTANALEGDRERCLAAGMNDYLTKPLKRERLRTAIEQWLPEAQREAAALL
jgi:signal transduction histidine kinase/ActR/RegA family two-component response regulator